MERFVDLYILSCLPAVLAFLWFKTDAFYTYLNLFLPIFGGYFYSLRDNLFLDYEAYGKYSKYTDSYCKYIKVKYNNTFWGELLGCSFCFITFLALGISVIYCISAVGFVIFAANINYYILNKICAPQK